MKGEIVGQNSGSPPMSVSVESFSDLPIPAVIAREGERASIRFIEFFTANIRNPNTRAAYARAVWQFLEWTEERRLPLQNLNPIFVSAQIEGIQSHLLPPSVKQHLAAIRMLFDYLVIGQVVPHNPAASVRGPKHVVKKGKTPVLKASQARQLLHSIDTSTLVGLRDRAIIAVMVFSFARVGAVVGMNKEDYFQNGKRWWLRLHEKGGKRHEVPAHHSAEEYLDAYLEATKSESWAKKAPLFRTLSREKSLTEARMTRTDVLRMVKRRAEEALLPDSTCCHTFRATGITAYLENGGTIENAQMIAAHESPRTTKLYDRTGDEITLDEIEQILI
jgi:integrase/recombinase XerD